MKISKNVILSILAVLALLLTAASACKSGATTTSTTTTKTTTSASATTSAPATYPNAALLVNTSWLNTHASDANLTIIDARAASDFGAGHVQNAVNLPPATLDGPGAAVPTDKTDLQAVQTVANLFGQAGISNTAKIVVYGANIDPNVGRIFWDLEYLGAKDVHVLDGGFDKWKKDGLAVATDAVAAKAATFSAGVDSTKLATKASVLASLNNGKIVLADERNYADYTASHIPGAVSLLIGELVNTDNTMKSYSDLTALFSSKGITPGTSVITYCYIGYRSAEAYFAFRLMGYPVANYDGSWTEWSADTSLPTQH